MVNETLKIAIIDDDSVDRLTIRRLLTRGQDNAFTPIEFADPETALDEIPELALDAILLDYSMGSMSGLEVLNELRHRRVDVPVVCLTGQADMSVAVALLQAGAYDYVQKSQLSTNSLRRALSNALEKHSLRRAVRRYKANIEEQNRQLLARTRENEAFYHTLSHELKTPLTSLREFLSILLDRIPGELTSDQDDYLRICKSSCDQLADMINDLLDIARLDTGKLSMEIEAIGVAGLLNEVVEMQQPAAHEREIELSICHACPGVVWADEGRARQVLLNLINNSIKFTEPGGTVVIGATERTDCVEFSVCDSGRGIAPEEIETIFNRLHQCSEGDAALLEGLGLGLSLCKELVQRQRGEIWVTSKVGEGASFFFTLPTAPASQTAAPQT